LIRVKITAPWKWNNNKNTLIETKGMKMKKQKLHERPLASSADIQRLFGELDASTISAVMGLGPTLAEAEEAALWTAGEGETLPEAHQPGSVIAQILDLVAPEEDDERRTPR
jgi:hypothetical protein